MSNDAPEAAADFWDNFIDQDWLDRTVEAALEPDLPIVDPHHHLWPPERANYGVDALLRDLTAGHNVRATVYLETFAYYRTSGPEALRPVGETEYVAAVAEKVAETGGLPAVAAGIIGKADLTAGDHVQGILDAHIEAGRGRFKGVRSSLYFDPEVEIGYPGAPQGFSRRADFRAGFARLAPLGLVSEIVAFHTNLPEMADLARASPDTTIVMNHIGSPLGRGPYAAKPAEVFRDWRANMQALSHCPNVMMKLGGLAGPFFGPLTPLKLRERPAPVSSEELANLMRPFIEAAIEAFGPERCMFESNFPADKYDCSYVVLWNAFKRIAQGYSPDEKRALFSGTAARVYSLNV